MYSALPDLAGNTPQQVVREIIVSSTGRPTLSVGIETSNDHPQYAKANDTITVIINPSVDLKNQPTVTISGVEATVTEEEAEDDFYTDTSFDWTEETSLTDEFGYTTATTTVLTDTTIDLIGHTYDIVSLVFNNRDNTLALELSRDGVYVDALNVLTGVDLTITDNNTPTNTVTIPMNYFSPVVGTHKVIYDAGVRDATSTNPLLHDWSSATGTLTISLSRREVYLATADVTTQQIETPVYYTITDIVDTNDLEGDDKTNIETHITIDNVAPTLSSTTDIGTTTDTTPDFSFTSDEDGTFALSGSCSTNVATDVTADTPKTITLSTLKDGVYSNCAITVTDMLGNHSLPLAIPSFTIDTTAPSPRLTLIYQVMMIQEKAIQMT